MIDIKRIRDDRPAVQAALDKRGAVLDLDRIILADEERRRLLREIEAKRAERNTASESVGRLMREAGQAKKAGGSDEELRVQAEALKRRSTELGDEIANLELDLNPVEQSIKDMMLEIPNIPDQTVPVGKDESANVLVRTWGGAPSIDFEAKAHWEIGEDLDIIDFARAAKIAGARFALYKGAGARLERALINLMLDIHTRDHGYTELLPPILVNEASMMGTGQLPKFADDLFKCASDDLWLIPTAEVPVTNVHRDETILRDSLPLKYTAFTPCFRREAGAHGRETRGLIRQHQFNKVELVKFVEPKSSYDELESLTADAEKILQILGLHYRVVSLATGDLGFSAAKTYDLEVWLPSYNDFKEISSCSNFEDFQARRANIRYKPAGGKPQFLHTLNGSGLAIGRTVAAVLENYQQEDGSVRLPDALEPYMGETEIKRRP